MAAYYDFFRQIVLQPNDVTIEADSVSDTLTITAANGVAFGEDVLTDSFTIDVNYQLYVPIGSTSVTLQDINSNSTEIKITAGQNINVSRVGDDELVISGIFGGIAKNIINATQTNPVVITTSTNHDFTSSVFVTIEIVTGMTQLNNNSYYVDILSPNSFALYTDGGLTSPLDGTGFSAYSGPSGTATAYFFTTGTYYTDSREAAIRADIEPVLATAIQPGDLLVGDLKGSVFGDDSTVLVDGVNNNINLDGTVNGNIIPDADEAYDIGSPTKKFRDLYLSGTTIYLGTTPLRVVNGTFFVGGVALGAGSLQGDLKGSVFGDDSTLLVDSVNSRLSTNNLSQAGAADGQILTWSSSSNSWVPGASNTFDGQFSSLSNVPTTVAGYGITDAYSHVDITNTNGLTTTYYLTFVDNLSTEQILRADIDLKYRTDTNTLTASVFEGNLLGDVKGSVFGDDSTLLIDGSNSLIPASVVQGTFTGNVIGNLLGDVTGNVTGNLLGNVTGNVVGDVTGNVTGDIKGSVFGDDSTLLIDSVNSLIPASVVQGTFTGNVIGNVTGNVTGNLLGNVTGNVTGNLLGDVTGNVTGDIKGSVFGDDSTLLIDGPNSLIVGTVVGELDVVDPIITGQISSSDSSPIVFVPVVEMRSDLNVDNGIFIQSQPVATEQFVRDTLISAALINPQAPTTVLSITNILDEFLDVARAVWLVDDSQASQTDNLYADGVAETALDDAKAYTDAEIINLIDSAPSDLNTLDKLAFAINNDPLFYQTVGSGSTLALFSVSTATASGGGSLSYDNTTGAFTFTPPALSSYLTSIGSLSIDALSDVNTTTTAPTNGQALVWNGTTWVPGSVAAPGGGGSTTFVGLTDTPSAFTGNGDYFVKVNSAATALVFTADPGYLTGSSSIDALNDVDTTTVAPQNGQGLVWNGTKWVPSAIPSLGSFSITTGSASGGGSLSYNTGTGVFSFAPADLSSFVNRSSFSVSSATASGSGALSYNNTTGAFTFTPPDLSGFVTSSSAITLSSFSVSSATASGSGTLSYNNTTGAFTFTPPDVSSFVSRSSFSVSSGTASGGGSLSYDNTTGAFTFTPADVSSFVSRSSFSVTTGSASGGGSLSYDNTTGVFSFAPAEPAALGNFVFTGSNIDTDDSSEIIVTPQTRFSSDVITDNEFKGDINWNYIFNTPKLLAGYGIQIGDPLLTSVTLTASTALTSAISTLTSQITTGDSNVTALIPTDLSDLTDTTDLLFDEANISTDLLPEPTATRSLGSLTKRWLNVWTQELSLGQKSITVSGTAPNEIINLPSGTTVGGNAIVTSASAVTLSSFSVSTGSASSGGSLSYNNTTGAFSFAPADLSTFTTRSSFSVSTATASGGGALSYNNTTGAFTFTPSAGIALTSLSVSSATASGSGSLSYNNTTGAFTFTPPDVSSFVSRSSFSVSTAAASSGGALSYNNSTGAFTFTPADVSTFVSRSSFSVSTATASSNGSLAYNNSTGVFTFTPPALGNYVTTDTTQDITGAKTFTTNNLRMNDNIELEIGSGADMEIYHNGTDNYIDLNVGNLLIRDNTTSRFSFARTTGDFIATGDVTAYGTISDIRQKENLVKIDNALEKVLKLNGYTFNYIGNDQRITGVVAQEVLEVLPEAVYTTKKLDTDEEIYAVRHGNMVGLLIETIKELSAKITELEKRLS